MEKLERVRRIQYKGKDVLMVDYSNSKGDMNIEIFEKARALILNEKKQVVVVNIFNNKTLISPDFMRHIELNLPDAEKFIDKQAIIGLSTIQAWILKGMNLWYEKGVKNFDSLDEALDFLTMN